jgi:hypothetical protein
VVGACEEVSEHCSELRHTMRYLCSRHCPCFSSPDLKSSRRHFESGWPCICLLAILLPGSTAASVFVCLTLCMLHSVTLLVFTTELVLISTYVSSSHNAFSRHCCPACSQQRRA